MPFKSHFPLLYCSHLENCYSFCHKYRIASNLPPFVFDNMSLLSLVIMPIAVDTIFSISISSVFHLYHPIGEGAHLLLDPWIWLLLELIHVLFPQINVRYSIVEAIIIVDQSNWLKKVNWVKLLIIDSSLISIIWDNPTDD